MWFKTFVILLLMCLFGICWSEIGENSTNYSEDESDDNFNTNFRRVMKKLDIISSHFDEIQQSAKKTEHKIEVWNEKVEEKLESLAWNETECDVKVSSRIGNIFGKVPSPETVYDWIYPKRCQWLIEAGHRKNVKLTLRQLDPYKQTKSLTSCNVTVLTLNPKDVIKGVQNIITTGIFDGDTKIFKGPFILLECFFSVLNIRELDYVEFEGTGQKSFTNANFTNYFITLEAGNLTLDLENHENNSSLQYQLKVITWPGPKPESFSANHWNMEIFGFEHSFCEFSFLTLFTGNDGENVFDCCKLNCSNYKFIIGENFARLVFGVDSLKVVDSKLEVINPKVIWERRGNVDGDNYTIKDCGGKQSGLNFGSVEYKPSHHNARCVWVIHPFPSREILVKIYSRKIEKGFEHFSAIEIREDGSFQTTDLSNISLSEPVWSYPKLTLSGRFILIVLFTDDSVFRADLKLDWVAVPPNNYSLLQQDDHIHESFDFNSLMKTNFTVKNPKRPGQHLFVINSSLSVAQSLNMYLSYGIEGSSELRVYGINNGIFEQFLVAKNATLGKVQKNFASWDSIFIMVVNVLDKSSEVAFEANWTAGEKTIPNIYERCGGVITLAEKTWISYKPAELLDSFDRCSWFILSTKRIQTFKLLKENWGERISGKRPSPGYVTIETFDPESGEFVQNSSIILKTKNSSTSVSSPIVVVTLAREYLYLHTVGFVLEMEAFGDSFTNGTADKYRIVNLFGSDQMYKYSESNKLTILAYNRGIPIPSSAPLNLKGKLGSEFSGSLTLNIFSYPPDSRSNSASAFVQSASCSMNGIAEWNCTVGNRATENPMSETLFSLDIPGSEFLAVIKPISSSDKNSNPTGSFVLDWEEEPQCGGRISAESGIISYKDGVNETYGDKDHCIWIVDVTQFGKSRITFNLEFVELKDASVNVVPVNIKNGSIGRAKGLNINNNLTLEFSIVLVTVTTNYYGGGERKGFRLNFSSGGQANNTKGWISVFLRSENHDFILPESTAETMGENSGFLLVVNPILIKYVSIPKAILTVKELPLFFAETCESDSIKFYEFDGWYNHKLKMTYTAFRDDEASALCLSNENQENGDGNSNITLSCASECYQKNVNFEPKSAMTFVLTPPFIVVYRSVSQAKFKKQLSFEWDIKYCGGFSRLCFY